MRVDPDLYPISLCDPAHAVVRRAGAEIMFRLLPRRCPDCQRNTWLSCAVRDIDTGTMMVLWDGCPYCRTWSAPEPDPTEHWHRLGEYCHHPEAGECRSQTARAAEFGHPAALGPVRVVTTTGTPVSPAAL